MTCRLFCGPRRLSEAVSFICQAMSFIVVYFFPCPSLSDSASFISTPCRLFLIRVVYCDSVSFISTPYRFFRPCRLFSGPRRLVLLDVVYFLVPVVYSYPVSFMLSRCRLFCVHVVYFLSVSSLSCCPCRTSVRCRLMFSPCLVHDVFFQSVIYFDSVSFIFGPCRLFVRPCRLLSFILSVSFVTQTLCRLFLLRVVVSTPCRIFRLRTVLSSLSLFSGPCRLFLLDVVYFLVPVVYSYPTSFILCPCRLFLVCVVFICLPVSLTSGRCRPVFSPSRFFFYRVVHFQSVSFIFSPGRFFLLHVFLCRARPLCSWSWTQRKSRREFFPVREGERDV